MKVMDLNLLLYAINRDSVHHEKAKTWLEATLSGDESIALPWVVVLGFLRIATNPRILPRPLTSEEAISVVDGWFTQPAVRVLHPDDDHWRTLKTILAECGTAGNLTTDAHLAAMAIENGCEICSTDADFQRFPRLKWTNPLQG